MDRDLYSAFLVSDGEVEKPEPVASAPLSVYGQSYNLSRTITARLYGGPIGAHLHPRRIGTHLQPLHHRHCACGPTLHSLGAATSTMFASECWTRHEQARSSSVLGWLPPTLKRLRDLLRLPSDWDGYGAAETRLEDAVDALIFLRRVMLASTPLPAIVPLNDGGVQLEWHESGLDFEATFTGGADRGFYLHDRHTREDTEGSIEKGIAELRGHMDRF